MKITIGWITVGLLAYIAWLLSNLVESKKVVEVVTTEEISGKGRDSDGKSETRPSQRNLTPFPATG